MNQTSLRAARIEDAKFLAKMVNHAGQGMPFYLWEKMADRGESAWDIGRQRAERETGGFSYCNATIIEHNGQPAGALIGYEIEKTPTPIEPDMPAMFKPLQELENLALDTWYVNVLAVDEPFRNLGLGTHLLEKADEIGQKQAKKAMSIIVADTNRGARKLYERLGYNEIAQRPMIKDEWTINAEQWILLTKTL